MKSRSAKALAAWLSLCLLAGGLLLGSQPGLVLSAVAVAERFEVTQSGLAVPLLRRERLALPHREPLPGPQRLHLLRYELDISAHIRPADLAGPGPGPAGVPGLSVLVSQVRNGMDIYLNGVWIAGLPQSDAVQRHKWYRPLLAPLPRKLLRAQGPNVLTVQTSTWEPYAALSPFYIGDTPQAGQAYELFLLVSSSLAKATNLICLLAGLFLLVTWMVNPRDGALYGQAGAATMLWAATYTLLQWSSMPVALYPLWHGLLYACIGALVVLLTLFLLNFVQRPLAGAARLGLCLFGALGSLGYLLAGPLAKPLLDDWWLPLLLMAYLYACAHLARYAWTRRSTASIALLLQSALSLLFALHDVNVQAQRVHMAPDDRIGLADLLTEPFYLSHLSLPLLLFVVAHILLSQYEAIARRIREANQILTDTLRQRERELLVSYNRQRELENQEVMQVERDRIYRELHDGIGSKLVTTLFGVREGDISRAQLEQQLLNTLADLREIISVTHVVEERDIQSLVFDFAFRLDSALSSAGFEVEYDIESGHELVLLGDGARHVLRILEETLANTVKHAHASRLELALRLDEQGPVPVLCLRLADNGKGSDGAPAARAAFPPSGGSGLAGMRRRAAAMGAHYQFDRGPRGAQTELRLPLLGGPADAGGGLGPFERRKPPS